MLNKFKSLIFIAITVFSPLSYSGIIFDFSIPSTGGSGTLTSSDTFSLTFASSSHFGGGLIQSDFESYSFNFGGNERSGSFPYSDFLSLNLDQLFNFTDLGNGSWQLDIMTGSSSEAYVVINGASDSRLQLGSNDYTSVHTDNYGSWHTSTTNLTAVSTTTQVPEPSPLALVLLSIAVLGHSKKRKLKNK